VAEIIKEFKPCPQCGKKYWSYFSNPRRYCSPACRSEANHIFSLCKNCGKEFKHGTDEQDNLTTACFECNSGKHSKIISDEIRDAVFH